MRALDPVDPEPLPQPEPEITRLKGRGAERDVEIEARTAIAANGARSDVTGASDLCEGRRPVATGRRPAAVADAFGIRLSAPPGDGGSCGGCRHA